MADAESPDNRQRLRARCLDAIDALAENGAGHHIVVQGGPGYGKTALVGALAAHARALGLIVIAGAATGFDASTPFAPLKRLTFESGAAVFSPTMFTPGQLDAGSVGRFQAVDADRFSVAESVGVALESELSAPAVLVLEDLHWADPATRQVVLAIAELARSIPLVLITTVRLGADEYLQRAAEIGASVETLANLDAADVAALVAEVVGADPDPDILARVSAGAGHPLLVAELIDGLLEDATGEVSASDDADRIPKQLRDAIERRLAQLDLDTATTVRAASVLGPEIDVGLLSQVLDRAPLALQQPLAAAIEGGLLEERDSTLRFRHELVRVGVYESMLASVRTATHQQVAAILAHSGASPALVGTHLVLGGASDDPDVIEKLHRAAGEAAPYAPDAALTFLDRARDLASAGTESRRVIERARLDALTSAGRLAEAEEVGNWLLRITPEADRAELQARLAGLAMLTGDGQRAMDLLHQARSDAADETVEAPILALAASTSLSVGAFAQSRELAAEAMDLGERIGDPVAQSVGLALTGRLSTFANDYGEGLRLGAASVAIADTDNSGLAHQYLPCLYYGLTCLDVDRFELVDAMVTQGRSLASSGGVAWSLPLFGSLAAAVAFRRGDLDVARAEADVAVELADRTGSLQAQMWSQSILALVGLEHGELPAARQWVDTATTSFASGKSPLGSDLLALARGRVAFSEGSERDGLDELAFAWDLFVQAETQLCLPPLALDLGVWAHDVGDTDRLAAAADAMAEAAASSDVASFGALAKWLAALRDGDLGGAGQAIEIFRGTQRVHDLACLLRATAEKFPCPPKERDRLLDDAYRLFVQCGATQSAADIDQLRKGPAASGPTLTGWGSLTPTEVEIARALAEGSTNAQIAQQRGGSRRTVESHLGRIYRKLGIDGRVKLTVEAAQHFADLGTGDAQ